MKEAFELYGKVEAVLVGASFNSLATVSVKKIHCIRGHGIRGDGHAGARLADVREKELLSFGLLKGTEIANFREFSAISVEELSLITEGMELPHQIPYGSIGENLVLSGIPKFTELPTGTLLFFKNGAQIRTAVLTVWAVNNPCRDAGEIIQDRFPTIPNLAARFPKAAINRRGVVGSIYSSGYIHAGDTVVAKIPRQRIYFPE
jgi:hypothetical protein